MKIARVLLVSALVSLLGGLAAAQSIDAFFGMSTLVSKKQSGSSGLPNLGGGLYPNVGADLMLFHRVGIGGEVSWRGSTTPYFCFTCGGNGFAAPVRPIYYDFNLVFVPISVPQVSPELQLGFGSESLRFYKPYYTCGTFTGCTNYSSSNHLAGHAALGLRFYVKPHIFLRPEGHFYFIRNNKEYSVGHATRVGMSIGYTLGPS